MNCESTYKGSSNGNARLKFAIFSIIGIFIFFINITINEKTSVPLIHAINSVKGLLGARNLQIMAMLVCISVLITSLIARFGKNDINFLKAHHKKDTWFSYFTYTTAAIFSVMIVLDIGPAFILDKAVGLSSIRVASDIVVAIVVASVLVTFLVEYGLLEFLGKLLEPVMRIVFKIPGKAAVDALSSFVASPAVGVMITNGLYKKKVYTAKEACAITTCFSFASIGGFAFLSGLAGCADYFSHVVITALILGFIMAMIMVRIPILCWKKDVYYDGTLQTPQERKSERYSSKTFFNALDDGLNKAQSTHISIFYSALVGGAGFAQKVCAYIVSLSVIFLTIANYTSIVQYIGKPIEPILVLLGMPQAEIIAPGVLVGFFAMSLPATLAAGKVSAMAAFFVVVLSTCQIIFFTESANAMLESEMPLSFLDLLLIFLIRTVILIPLVAVATHIIF